MAAADGMTCAWTVRLPRRAFLAFGDAEAFVCDLLWEEPMPVGVRRVRSADWRFERFTFTWETRCDGDRAAVTAAIARVAARYGVTDVDDGVLLLTAGGITT